MKWFVLAMLFTGLSWHWQPSSAPPLLISSWSGDSTGDENYLPIPPVLPDDGPRSGYPRGLPRLGAGEDVVHIDKIEIDGQMCPVEVLNGISRAATATDLPASRLAALARLESGFNLRARRYTPGVEDSRGPFQLNVAGGFGAHYQAWELEDPHRAPEIVAEEIARRLDERPHDKERDRWMNALDFWRAAREVVLEETR